MRAEATTPSVFCWTKFGTEAGEPIDSIVARKEAERQANGGIFYWGIGNSIAPGVIEALRRGIAPEVLFSPIKTKPRHIDVSPPFVVRWRGGVTLLGEHFELPDVVRVTSASTRTSHYALVCDSAAPLRLGELGHIDAGSLRNIGSGRRLGASQITSVVERSGLPEGRIYTVALRARLVEPYFVRLTNPEPVAVRIASAA